MVGTHRPKRLTFSTLCHFFSPKKMTPFYCKSFVFKKILPNSKEHLFGSRNSKIPPKHSIIHFNNPRIQMEKDYLFSSNLLLKTGKLLVEGSLKQQWESMFSPLNDHWRVASPLSVFCVISPYLVWGPEHEGTWCRG